jgi:hypothetical protein
MCPLERAARAPGAFSLVFWLFPPDLLPDGEGMARSGKGVRKREGTDGA